jgi:hypothetical protein
VAVHPNRLKWPGNAVLTAWLFFGSIIADAAKVRAAKLMQLILMADVVICSVRSIS